MQVQKWGNSLAVRLPKKLCEAVAFEEGKEVDFQIVENSIIIRPKKKDLTLDEMVSMITPENLHEEHFAEPMGKEIL